MIDLMLLLWYFLVAQPPARLAALLPWHLLFLIGCLLVLAAFGIHFLVGYVAGFYRRRERIARWVSLPSLLIFLISVQLLVGAYLLGFHGSWLVSINQTDSVVQSLGAHLLDPAFENPALAAAPQGEIPKQQLEAAFKAFTESRYREAIAKKKVALEKLTASTEAASQKGRQGRLALSERILVQIGLRWITAPHKTWWTPFNSGGVEKSKADRHGEPEAKADRGNGIFLPVFLAGLISELADDDQLSRANWEYIAGTRFVERYLQPVMVEYLGLFAIALALVVVLFNLLFFLAMRRLKRIGLGKPEKTAQQLPAATDDSSAETTEETTEETGAEASTKTGVEASTKSLPASGAEPLTETNAKTSAVAAKKIPEEIPEEISEEISAAFPRTAPATAPANPGAAFPADQGAGAPSSPPGDGGAGTPKGESSPQSAEPKAGEEARGELLLEKEQKKPEPAGIVKK